jgi:hypothetical protein
MQEELCGASYWSSDQISNYIEQSPSLKAVSLSVRQAMPCHMGPEGSLPCSQNPTSSPVLNHMNAVPTLPMSLISILILFSHAYPDLPRGPSHLDFPIKILQPFPISTFRATCPTSHSLI